MWAQTYYNGNRYYREQKGTRGAGYCVGRSRSMPCRVPDEQIGRIVSAMTLPDAWMDRVLAEVQLADEVKRVDHERVKVDQRLKRLGEVYLDGLKSRDDYRREKRFLEDQLASLVVPGVDAAHEAGKLLEELPRLWEEADLGERRKLLMTMLEAVYVDTSELKSIVAIVPKPAFRSIFEIAMTRPESGVILVTEKDLEGWVKRLPPADDGSEAANLCSWWRRGRVGLHRERGLIVLLAA